MKTTEDKIEVLEKAGKILSRIFFILSAVGIVALVIATVYLFATNFPDEKIEEILVKHGYSSSSVYLLIIVVAISLIGELFLSYKAEKYFSLTLEKGTPFTLEGAKNLLWLGIYCIIVPLLTNILTFLIFKFATSSIDNPGHSSGSITLGVMFIITSLLLKYGSEKKEDGND